MNNTNEPISDITAEIRAARNTSSDTTLVQSNWLDDWADRIERTANNMECAFGMALAIKDGLHKRDKRSSTCSVAKMCEALREIQRMAHEGEGEHNLFRCQQLAANINNAAKAALFAAKQNGDAE